ncbi:craniofacial development protein 2-like [Anneissia japonica]|uniref:craniofacial development protein 2-like n=1 Tax=Anneissia japonica TaxID=1529436 RepID=UPI001425A400|nr:craniofacial development protein 2-like [Anneissia japonica]
MRAIKLQINKKQDMKIIQVYDPTSCLEDSVVEEFYSDLEMLLTTEKTTYTIIIGDFNAKIGKNNVIEEVGKFGIGERNERGERLLEFVASRNLFIRNTFFKKNDRYWTWESPNAATHNLIDYVISNKRSILMDVAVIPKVDTGSDHRLVRAKIRIDKKMERARCMKRVKKKSINLDKLESRKLEFHIALQNRYAILEDAVELTSMDEAYEKVVKTILEEAEKLANGKQIVTIEEDDRKEISELNDKRKKLKPGGIYRIEQNDTKDKEEKEEST